MVWADALCVLINVTTMFAATRLIVFFRRRRTKPDTPLPTAREWRRSRNATEMSEWQQEFDQAAGVVQHVTGSPRGTYITQWGVETKINALYFNTASDIVYRPYYPPRPEDL